MGGSCSACTIQENDITEMRLDPRAGAKDSNILKQTQGMQDPAVKASEGRRDQGEDPSTPLLAKNSSHKVKGSKEGKRGMTEKSLEEPIGARTSQMPELPEEDRPAPDACSSGQRMSPAASPRKEAAAEKVVASLIGDVADRALDIALGLPAQAPKAEKQEPEAIQKPATIAAPTEKPWRHLPSVGTWLLRPSAFHPAPMEAKAAPKEVEVEPVPASFVAAMVQPVKGSFVAVPAAQLQAPASEGSFVALPMGLAFPSPTKAAASLALPPVCEMTPPSLKAAAVEAWEVAEEAEACEMAPPSPMKAAVFEEACEMAPPSLVKATAVEEACEVAPESPLKAAAVEEAFDMAPPSPVKAAAVEEDCQMAPPSPVKAAAVEEACEAAPPSPVKAAAVEEACEVAPPSLVKAAAVEEAYEMAPPSPVKAAAVEEACEVAPPSLVKAAAVEEACEAARSWAPASPTKAAAPVVAKAWRHLPSVGTWLLAPAVPAEGWAEVEETGILAPAAVAEDVARGEGAGESAEVYTMIVEDDVAAFSAALLQCAVDVSGSDLDVASIDFPEEENSVDYSPERRAHAKTPVAHSPSTDLIQVLLKAGQKEGAQPGTVEADLEAMEALKERMASTDEAEVVSQV